MKSKSKRNNMTGYISYMAVVLITLLFLGIFLMGNSASAVINNVLCQDYQVTVTNEEGWQREECWNICINGGYGYMYTSLIGDCILGLGSLGSDSKNIVSICNYGEYACSINLHGGGLRSLIADCMGQEQGGCMNCHVRGVAGCQLQPAKR